MKSLTNLEDLIKKAINLRNQEKFEDALELLEELYKTDTDSEKVKETFIDTLLSYGGYLNDDYTLEFKKAKNIFNKIIEIDPNNYRAYYNKGIAYFNLNEIEKAKQSYEKALSLKPDYKHCIYNLGLLYETIGDLHKALIHYEKALKIDSKFTYALQARTHIRKSLDELKEAKTEINRKQDRSQLISLLKMSNRIKIDIIQNLLDIDKTKLYELLIDLGEKFHVNIDGDFLTLNKKTLPELLKYLEDFNP